ncbi:unnamed protein product [Chironomus riparius]|uniref:Odorant receptor n=1 Tax=Chironomus riparius TaxID=315576 RepID=A0A9N9S7L2_9DIPT|nr:unnamed protein product [Chironomus riparius]
MSRLYGSHTADQNSTTSRFALVVFLAVNCIVMQINGLFHNWPNFIRICHSLMVEPIVFQLLTRITMRYINNDEQLVSDIHDTIDKFYKNEEKELDNQIILSAGVKLIEILSKSYMLLNFICFMIPPLSALIISWISGEFIMSLPFWLPFTDPTTTFGFTINMSLVTFYSVMFYDILISQDLFFINYTMQVIPIGDIFIHKMTKLGEKLSKIRENQKLLATTQKYTFDNLQMMRRNLNIQEHSIKQLEKQIISLIKSYNSYNDYISLIFPYMHYTTFVAISTSALGIGLSILVATFLSASIGISIMLIFTLQVLMTCFQGTIISYQNQKILDSAWDFPWYKMSVPMQKVWLQFIHQCQNSNELKIIIIGLLSMKSFTNVINGAYSYFMFILNFLKH